MGHSPRAWHALNILHRLKSLMNLHRSGIERELSSKLYN